jgi:hypothetical protein
MYVDIYYIYIHIKYNESQNSKTIYILEQRAAGAPVIFS